MPLLQSGTMKRRRFLQKAGIGALLAAVPLTRKMGTTEAEVAGIQRRPRNILLIMADDLGRECLGCYGSEQYKTPRLDRLAREGMCFTDCHSMPLCTPSRVAIMTGKSNVRNYVDFGALAQGERTFAHCAKKAGYVTCVAGKWQLSKGRSRDRQGQSPREAGFDTWCLWNTPMTTRQRYWDPSIEVDGQLMQDTEGKYGPDLFVDHLIRFMEENKDRPFLAYYPMALTHGPFDPTPSSESREEKNGQKNFEDMVSYMDFLVGRLVDALDGLGLKEETVIFFTADNGSPRAVRSRLHGRVLEGGKGATHRGGTHVALIVGAHGTVSGGKECHDLVGFEDFRPTLNEIMGRGEMDGEPWDGRSFWPQCRGEKGHPREWLYCYYHPWPHATPEERGYREKPERFAWDKRYKAYSDGRLYDMIEDPLEENPVALDRGSEEALAAHEKLMLAIASFPERVEGGGSLVL